MEEKVKILKNPYRNSTNKLLTKGLFYEKTLADKATVVYTLKPYDYKGYKSLKKLYLEEEDITEYNFSLKYLDGYNHWLLLCQSSWFKPMVAKWREELRLKLEHRYIEKLKEIAGKDTKEGLTAARMLLERNKKPKERDKTEKGYMGSGHLTKTHVRPSNSFLGDFERMRPFIEGKKEKASVDGISDELDTELTA